MQLTCPSCESRYNLPDEKIGEDGRTVKCVKCKTVWFARLSEPETDSQSPSFEPVPAAFSGNAPASFGSYMPDRPQAKRLSAPPKVKTPNPFIFPAALLAVCCFMVLIIIVGIRTPLLAVAPKTGVFYAMMGFPPEQPLKHLKFDRIKVLVEPSTRGTSAAKIEGQIINTGKTPAKFQSLLVTYHDNNKNKLGELSVRLKQNAIDAESVIRFKETLENIPVNTNSVFITFVP